MSAAAELAQVLHKRSTDGAQLQAGFCVLFIDRTAAEGEDFVRLSPSPSLSLHSITLTVSATVQLAYYYPPNPPHLSRLIEMKYVCASVHSAAAAVTGMTATTAVVEEVLKPNVSAAPNASVSAAPLRSERNGFTRSLPTSLRRTPLTTVPRAVVLCRSGAMCADCGCVRLSCHPI
jgi:hypothetical protein